MPTATVQWYYYKSIKSLKIALSNFAMFVIALVVGLKFEKTTNNEKKNFYVEDELNFTENNKIQDSEQTEEIKSESTQVNVNTNIKNEIIQSTTVESNISDIKTYNKENSTIGIFCIAGVFLVISIIFSIIFIKHQQKVIKKSSKK